MGVFNLQSEFQPAGDQPQAIKELFGGVKKGLQDQTLLGVTGSGKTFTVANLIEKVGKPTLVIAHNKTLAAQLAQEYREFFPEHEVNYFVSYYDYYQPEAYVAVSDTYIEKEAQINEEIDRLRHATTQSLLTRKDVIVVASVSCIYGLGSPASYQSVNLQINVGDTTGRRELIRQLINRYFERTNADLNPGSFRAVGNSLEIMPVNEKIMYRLDLEGNEIVAINVIDPISQSLLETTESFFIFPAKHFVSSDDDIKRATVSIKEELDEQLEVLKKQELNLEAERLKRRTNYDLALIREVGYVSGIENYSRHFDGRKAGEAPYTLLDYFPKKRRQVRTSRGQTQTIEEPDFLTIIDESHVTVPQLGGMYAGDASRKQNLVDYGFRLPSAKDNRPLQFSEFRERVGQIVYTSATPGKYEIEHSGDAVAQQIIRPTGLLDPEIELRSIQEKGKYPGQVHDFIKTAQTIVKKGDRVIATTLTKRMAEDLSDYLKEKKIKAEYLHSDIKTIERIEILTEFRKGTFDVLVGVNLLREGLDLPEVSFIGILDADKEGFLRSETSLIQTIGRAARNINGKVVLYADVMTGSMERAVTETTRRRKLQLAYNTKHGITPKTISKKIADITDQLRTEHQQAVGTLLKIDEKLFKKNPKKFIAMKEKKMQVAVKILDFETAAIIRDEIKALEELAVKDGRK